jgi:hypothetical protein
MGEMTRDFAKAQAACMLASTSATSLVQSNGEILYFVIVSDPSRSNLFGRAYSKIVYTKKHFKGSPIIENDPIVDQNCGLGHFKL